MALSNWPGVGSLGILWDWAMHTAPVTEGGDEERREGEKRADEENEEKGNFLFFREKDCWAWEKWAGMGRGVVATLVSMVTDMMSPSEDFWFY